MKKMFCITMACGKLRMLCWAGAILCWSVCQSASGAQVTGDPSVDAGWHFGGNSIHKGIYVQGEATFSFDIYSASFTLDGSSPLLGGSGNWQAGDQVLGLGGRFVSTTLAESGWSQFDFRGNESEINADISGSSRPVAKFGTGTSVFSASTLNPFGLAPHVDGQGSMSGGHGGDGAILMRATSNLSSGNAGAILTPHLLQRYNASGTATGLSTSFGRMVYTWSDEFATSHPGSWQFLLNLSLLDSQSPYNAYPAPGDRAIATVQRSTNQFTDGLISTIPEPSALALLALGGIPLLRRRRRIV